MMTSVTDYMCGDHRRCDDLFNALEEAVGAAEWERADAELEKFLAGMERHFELEEGTLFPAFESLTGMTAGPTQIMRGEHVQMRGLFLELRDACARRDEEATLGLTETLLVVMQQHNLKEEEVLYPMSDQALGADAAALVARMQAVPETP